MGVDERRDPDSLGNMQEICACLGIGRRRFEKWRRDAEPPMPVHFDGYSYVADRKQLREWKLQFLAAQNLSSKIS